MRIQTQHQARMARSRQQLALHRWLRNLDKAARRGCVQLPTAATTSTAETEAHKAPIVSGSIVVPHVDSVPIAGESETARRPSRDSVTQDSETVACHRNEDGRTRELKERQCDFCFERYTYRDYRSRYCSETCKQDAYQVRRAWRTGDAQHYYDSINDYVTMEHANA